MTNGQGMSYAQIYYVAINKLQDQHSLAHWGLNGARKGHRYKHRTEKEGQEQGQDFGDLCDKG